MMIIIYGILLAIGFYCIAADYFRIPYIKTTSAMKSLLSRQEDRPSTIDVWLGSLAVWISKHIHLNEYKRIQIESDLKTAEMNITPEMHTANAIVKALIVLVLAIPVYFIFPIGVPLLAVLAYAMYRQESKGVSLRIQAKREAIELELPRLVSTIEKTLLHSRDVLSLLDEYRKNAGPELKKQLDITTADMRSGNYEAAITRLEARVGSPMLSDMCRGLQGIIRGDDTTAYWSALSVKFSDHHRQIMKKKALAAPDKVRRLSMCLMFCFLLLYMVVISCQITESLSVMFN